MSSKVTLTRSTVVLSTVLSILVTIVLYAGISWFLDYISSGAFSENTANMIFLALLMLFVFGPSIIASVVLLPMLKKKK